MQCAARHRRQSFPHPCSCIQRDLYTVTWQAASCTRGTLPERHLPDRVNESGRSVEADDVGGCEGVEALHPCAAVADACAAVAPFLLVWVPTGLQAAQPSRAACQVTMQRPASRAASATALLPESSTSSCMQPWYRLVTPRRLHGKVLDAWQRAGRCPLHDGECLQGSWTFQGAAHSQGGAG